MEQQVENCNGYFAASVPPHQPMAARQRVSLGVVRLAASLSNVLLAPGSAHRQSRPGSCFPRTLPSFQSARHKRQSTGLSACLLCPCGGRHLSQPAISNQNGDGARRREGACKRAWLGGGMAAPPWPAPGAPGARPAGSPAAASAPPSTAQAEAAPQQRHLPICRLPPRHRQPPRSSHRRRCPQRQRASACRRRCRPAGTPAGWAARYCRRRRPVLPRCWLRLAGPSPPSGRTAS